MADRDSQEPRGGPDTQAIRDTWKPALPKRFYKTVEVVEAEGGFAITLDVRPVRTPLKNLLVVENRALCDAVAGEWEAQTENVDPAAMPLMRLANTALDRVAPRLDAIAGEIVSYAGSDLLCYRAERPDSLILRQAQHWDPILSWAEAQISARFVLAEGVMHHEQPREALEGFEGLLRAHDAFVLTGLHNITTLTGSALIAAAVAARQIPADAGWAAAHVDEDWQIEQWGRDEDAEARRAGRRREYDAAVRFIALAQS